MKITIEGASEEFEHKLLALLDDHRHELTVTADTEWTVERAEHYLRSLPAGARTFAKCVIVGDGRADADTLRDVLGKLNGPTVALSRAVPRGVREGWWPEGTTAPITVVYDPDISSWQKAIAYTMASENVPVFRAALELMDCDQLAATNITRTPDAPHLAWADEDVPSALEPPIGWGDGDDVPHALVDDPPDHQNR